jgi:hypothetical protein
MLTQLDSNWIPEVVMDSNWIPEVVMDSNWIPEVVMDSNYSKSAFKFLIWIPIIPIGF